VLARIHRREVDSRNDLQGLLLLLTALLNPETSVKPMVHVVSGYVERRDFLKSRIPVPFPLEYDI